MTQEGQGNVLAVQKPVSESATLMTVIERASKDPSVDVGKLAGLLDLYERIAARNAKAEYIAALAEMQPLLPVITERGRIEVRAKDASGERNGKLIQSTGYALWEDINDAIRPLLKEYGFSLSFRTGIAADGKITVTGILGHKAGHQEETTITLPHDSSGSKNAVQAVGSSTSYGKRYTTLNLLNITSRGDDDDGKKGGAPETISADQLASLQSLIVEVAADLPKFLKHFEIENVADLTVAQLPKAIDMLNAKRASDARKAGKAA